MAKRVQRRRGTTTEHASFTGSVGELTVDTTKKTLVVQDGSTIGGIPLAKEDLSNVTNKVGVTQLNLSDGTAGQVLKTDGSGTISFVTVDATSNAVGGDVTGTVGNIQIAANSVGITELNVSDGTANQILKTDGSGTLSFSSISSDPTMGGDLTGTASNAQIAANAVTATEIVTNAVTTAKITDLNVTTAKIADLNITTGKIAANAVTTAKITDLNVTTGKIAANAITEAKITAQTITNASIYPGTIRSQEIANGTITGTDIADNSISGSQIALGGDTQGDTMHYDGTNWARLGPGTSGWLLKTNGANANPSWVSPTTASLPAVGADGNVLTSDGSDWSSQASLGGVGGELVSIQSFAANGTWTKPSGVTRIRVCILGGGGGANANAGGQNSAGGGGGGYCESVFDVSSITTGAVVIGAGSVWASGSHNGPTNSTFTATGLTTMTATGGAHVSNGSTTAGAGGVATGGQLNLNGEIGSPGTAAGGSHGQLGGHGAGPFGSAYGSGSIGTGGSVVELQGSPGYCKIYEYSDASANLIGEKLVSQQLLTASSGTWTKPANITKIRVFVVGSGGGASTNNSGTSTGGGGGGGTGVSVVDVTNISTVAYTIPTFGVTTFSLATSIVGGQGGTASTTVNDQDNAPGGVAGTATGADLIIPGGIGGTGRNSTGHGAGGVGGLSYISNYGRGSRGVTQGSVNGNTLAGGGQTTGCIFIEEYSDPSLVSGRLGNTFSTNASNKIQHIYLGSVTGGLTGTWTKPTGVTHIHVQVVAGGQAGGIDFSGDPPAAGVTGSAGAYSENIIDVSNITSLDWVVGGVSTTTASSWGGYTYFGSNGTLHSVHTHAVTMTVTVVSGVITAIANPPDLGSGMTIPPLIVIEPNATSATGRGGAGAVATAQISGGSVTGITVTNGGTGYVSGQVQAYCGVGAVRSIGFGSSGNLSAAKTTSTYLQGTGGGGAGEPSGGGAAGAGGWGGIYIKEYR